jgi:demethoxyubiquinone hydroxylase (CLK1/Coq7/Cat5 family)
MRRKTTKITVNIDEELYSLINELKINKTQIINDLLHCVLKLPEKDVSLLEHLIRVMDNCTRVYYLARGKEKETSMKETLNREYDKLTWIESAINDVGVTPSIVALFVNHCRESGIIVGGKSVRLFLEERVNQNGNH